MACASCGPSVSLIAVAAALALRSGRAGGALGSVSAAQATGPDIRSPLGAGSGRFLSGVNGAGSSSRSGSSSSWAERGVSCSVHGRVVHRLVTFRRGQR